MYLSTTSVEWAYKKLSELDVKNPSLLHIFFILKGCGYNSMSYTPVSKLNELAFGVAEPISSLFSPAEKWPDKYDFINPFDMSEWGTGAPTESLKKWSGGRIKNNVLGGATTWRRLVDFDVPNDEFRFTYDYLESLQELTLAHQKISILALSIWSQRFVNFESEPKISDLVSSFKIKYHLSEVEESTLFSSSKGDAVVTYDELVHDSEKIRQLIGNPDSDETWVSSSLISDDRSDFTSIFKKFIMPNPTQQVISPELLKDSLRDYKQVLLSGPPATSKSYLANEVAASYDKVYKIQFHPHYSYSDFIGGYIVDGEEVQYKKGVFLDILDFANANLDKSVLLVIDEVNRANVSQVLGEVVQCLDRNYVTELMVDKELTSIQLPDNLHIVATMNSTDRTIGSLDHAVRRRFLNIYVPPNPDVLIDLCSFDGEFSLSDFLKKINKNLVSALNNREMVIGQSLFLLEHIKHDGKYQFNYGHLEMLFNNKILPIIEEYTHGDQANIIDIVGEKLSQRLTGADFEEAVSEFSKS